MEDAGEAKAEPWRRLAQGTPDPESWERFPSAARKNEVGSIFLCFVGFTGSAWTAMCGRLRRCLEIRECPRGEDLGGAANEGVCRQHDRISPSSSKQVGELPT
jgi:hypothetical protein